MPRNKKHETFCFIFILLINSRQKQRKIEHIQQRLHLHIKYGGVRNLRQLPYVNCMLIKGQTIKIVMKFNRFIVHIISKNCKNCLTFYGLRFKTFIDTHVTYRNSGGI